MIPERYKSTGKAALIVSFVGLGLLAISFLTGRIPHSWGSETGIHYLISTIARPVGYACLMLLAFPGAIIFMPIVLRNIHSASEWYAALAIAVNWVLYVWGVKRIIDARQRKREARATVHN
jgi:hypothetical protein